MKHKTNWHKSLADPKDYKSNWDWTVAHSEYHFDKNRVEQEGDWFKILGTFKGDWSDELKKIIELSTPINWETRKYYGDNDEVSPMLEQEEYDIIQGGGDPKELLLTNMWDDFSQFPKLYKMADYFGLDIGNNNGTKKRIHVQLTGQMFNYHIDKLWDRDPINPERVARITVMLQDWEPGQFYMYGNYVYSHWKAGEAHIFDWPNVPHATANASNVPRATMQITGLKSVRSRRLIDEGNKNNVYEI